MRTLRRFFSRLTTLFSRRRAEEDFTSAVSAHLALMQEDFEREGMSSDAARRAARLKLGGVQQTRELCREARSFPLIESLWQDVRFGCRVLRKNPGFAAVAILTLALGIGANTAIFSAVNSILLRMLPVKDPQRLVLFTWDANKKWPPHWSQTGADEKFSFSYPAFAEFQRDNQVLSSVFAFVPLGFNEENLTVNRGGDTTSANGFMVSGDFFSGLGVKPFAGRVLYPSDDNPSAPRVAVLSFTYWNSRFGHDPNIVGSSVAFNGIPFTIVGVAPPGFNGVIPGSQPDVWIAFDDAPNLRPWSAKPSGSDSIYTARGWLALNIMGRLKPGVSREQAQSAMDVAFRRFVTQDQSFPSSQEIPRLALEPAPQGLPYLRRFAAQPLLMLMGAVGVVLLIACANVATLLLARAAARRKEIGVRLSIGASRIRLIRQLLTESLILSVIGGTLGLLAARWGTRALIGVPKTGWFSIIFDLTPDWRVAAVTILISVSTGILFGLAPALQASRLDLSASMKDSAGQLFATREKHRLGKSLVVVQVAGSLVLMVAAGLFLRTLVNLARNNYGFNQESLLTFGVDATRDGYQGDRLIDFYSQLLAQIKTVPGVNAATVMEFPPFASVSNNNNISAPGSPSAATRKMGRAQNVGPGFFQTMQIPLVLGRDINEADTRTSPPVVVVDQTLADALFPGGNPIGQRLAWGGGANPKPEDTFEIIGVVKPAELTDVHSKLLPKAYFPYPQHPRQLSSLYFEVRAIGDPRSLVSEIRDTVRRADPNLPLLALQTQTEIREFTLTPERILARLSIIFGVLALLIAVIGLYGTLSYAVARRTNEIGVRMALGAKPSDVLRMVSAQGLRLALAGLAIGLPASFAATRLIRGMMFGVTPSDPVTFAVVSALLLIVSFIACYIPARRATRVDPVSAMRCE